MDSNPAPASPHSSEGLRAWLPLAIASLAILVLSSLDQSTRGPSVTAMVLANLNLIF